MKLDAYERENFRVNNSLLNYVALSFLDNTKQERDLTHIPL